MDDETEGVTVTLHSGETVNHSTATEFSVRDGGHLWVVGIGSGRNVTLAVYAPGRWAGAEYHEPPQS